MDNKEEQKKSKELHDKNVQDVRKTLTELNNEDILCGPSWMKSKCFQVITTYITVIIRKTHCINMFSGT